MSKLGINALNRFLRTDLKVRVLEEYLGFNILSEADLQSLVWKLLTEFIAESDSTPKRFKVLNKPFLKGLRIHPDIVIFRKSKPWVIIELKERRELSQRSALKERDRLLKSRKEFKAKKGYLLYVSRYGDGRLMKGPKGEAAHYFAEVPIILQSVKTQESIDNWENEFKRWSKYVG